MEKLKKRIQQLKKKRPGYKEILSFYQKVREEHVKIKSSLKLQPIHIKKEWKELLAKEGFPLFEKKDLPIDIEASVALFQSLCDIGKDANPYMAEQVKKIEETIDKKRMDLKKILSQGFNEQKIEKMANEFLFDKKVFLFLIYNSIKPSIEAEIGQWINEIDTHTWLKGFCPICGSLPLLSFLKEEVGTRSLLCSFCGYPWRIDRLWCPFCDNKQEESLHYFYAEGEEIYRIDLCDQCHQYIKTIDLRKIEEPDLLLEDLATLHLDILASQKGYRRPIPNLWAT